MDFSQAEPILQGVARYFVQKNPAYEVNELVNEAWIRGRGRFGENIALAAYRDIIDYLRQDGHNRVLNKPKTKSLNQFIKIRFGEPPQITACKTEKTCPRCSYRIRQGFDWAEYGARCERCGWSYGRYE